MECVDLAKLNAMNERIKAIADGFGLSFPHIEFEVIPSQKMLEIMAYGLPINFSHWSFGRDYEAERTKYEHGFSLPNEVVFDGGTARAFLMRTNPLPFQTLVMAHVYGHSDFFKNNAYFSKARKDMLQSAALAAERIGEYGQKYSRDAVEKILDAALSIVMNVDPSFFLDEETEEDKRERLAGIQDKKTKRPFDPFDGLTNETPKPAPNLNELKKKLPLEPERDVIGFIAKYSPKLRETWEKDVLQIVKEQGLYDWPHRRTKIMNEGWASYWHQKIMEELFREGMLTAEDHGLYNFFNSGILAFNRRMLNPYLVGCKIWQDIEERWNKGRFGKEWEECLDPFLLRDWDKKLGLGRKQIMAVRKAYSDRMFLEQFLTDQLIHDLDLYIYEEQTVEDEVVWVIKERDPAVIRKMLVRYLTDYGIPVIMVEDGNYHGNRELYLKHYYEEMPLDPEYRDNTLSYIQFLWGRTVYLETQEINKEGRSYKVVYSKSKDGSGVTKSVI